MQAAFQGWMAAVIHLQQGEVVAIDGKHLRQSYDTWHDVPALQVVNAWATVRLRTERRQGEKRTTGERLFITFLPTNAKQVQEAVRAH
jgi:hypothetical protein